MSIPFSNTNSRSHFLAISRSWLVMSNVTPLSLLKIKFLICSDLCGLTPLKGSSNNNTEGLPTIALSKRIYLSCSEVSSLSGHEESRPLLSPCKSEVKPICSASSRICLMEIVARPKVIFSKSVPLIMPLCPDRTPYYSRSVPIS